MKTHPCLCFIVALALVLMAATVVAGEIPGVASPVLDRSQMPAFHAGVRSPGAVPPGAGITSVASVVLAGGNRLVATQNTDGGWGWPLTGTSAQNTVGPIAMGLAQAYQYSGATAQRTALQQAGAFLLAKTNTFSPSDGYLAAELDGLLGGSAYTTHVITNFYGPLAAGTYNHRGLGTLYTTASFVLKVRTDRASQGIANLAAWDLGMGLLGAASAGAATADWVAGVKAEIDELDANAYYDVVGLAGAVHSLAFVGEEHDPVAGSHAAASSLADLGAILAGYQIAGGGFTWNSGYVSPGNETNQETAYAILALNELNRAAYLTALQGAAGYLMGVQLGSGGWDNYPGDPDGENSELTGEVLWGITTAFPPPVHNVTRDIYYAVIQTAINEANAGDLITAAAGTYTENVTVNRRITLQGSGSSVAGTVITPPSGVGMVISASGASASDRLAVSDLRVTGATGSGIDITAGNASFVTLQNVACISNGGNGVNTNPPTGSGNFVDLRLLDCDLSSNAVSGLRFASYVGIDGLTIVNGHMDGNVYGFQSYAGAGSPFLTNVSVTGTTFNGNSSKGMYFENMDNASFSGVSVAGSGTAGAWAAGVDMNLKYHAFQNILFTNCTITNCGTGDAVNGVGMAVKARDDGGYAGNPATLNNVQITGCVISGCQEGLRFGEPTKNNAGPASVLVRSNSITGSVLKAIRNESQSRTDASGNWLGLSDPTAVASAIGGNVDYTPWLGNPGDTSGDPGFQGDYSNLWVDDNSPQVGSVGRVQEGVNSVTGSTVHVAPGVYNENVLVSNPLSLLGAGAGSTTINGGNAGNCITLAANGVTVDGFTLTNGHNGISGETSNSTISNCTVHTNINTPGSAGAGILFWGNNDNNTIAGNSVYNNDRQGVFIGYLDATKISTGNVIRNNTIHDNGLAFPTSPDPSRYGIQLHCADQNLIQGNNVYNHLNDVNWSFSVGIYLNGSRQNTVSGNTLNDNSLNIVSYAGTMSGTRSTTGNIIQGNTLLNPGIWSIRLYSDAASTFVNFNVFSTGGTSDKYIRNSGSGTLNAQYNWFGGENPPQTTDFQGLVDYTHWYATDPTVSVFPALYYLPTGSTVTLNVMAMLPAGVFARGIDVTLNWTNDAQIPDQGDPVEGSFFSGFPSHLYLFNHLTGSSVQVNSAILGPTTGAGNPTPGFPYVGTIFSQDFDALSQGSSALTLSGVQIRDPNNNPITPVVIDPPGGTTLIADGAAPVVAGALIDNTTLDNDTFVKNGDNVTVTATVTDSNPLTLLDITADLSGLYGGSGHTADNPATYVGDVATWTVSGVACSPADGPITVTVTATDAAANVATGSDGITADNTLPTVATNLVAKTISPGGHEKVALTWTAGSDANYRGVMIRYNGWSYPGYPAGSPPSYPATPTAGTAVSALPIAGSSTTHAVTARNVHYYSTFAIDWAGNAAALDPTATDHSADYYLGDLGSGTGTYIPGSGGYNGQVNYEDLYWFSRLYFSTSPGWTALDPNAGEADFGPTLGNKTYPANHRFGIARPDGRVDFEDLMIFSMNYNNVAPRIVAPAGSVPADELALELAGNTRNMVAGEQMVVTLHLANNGQPVKGSSVELQYNPASLELVSVEPGMLFGSGDQGFFSFRQDDGRIRIDQAILGTGRALEFSSDLAVARFVAVQSGEARVTLASAILRSGENQGFEPVLRNDVVALPLTFALAQNYPNPFNPSTVIDYALPTDSRVILKLYDALGQEVATLVDEFQPAGYKSVVWNGKNLSTGVYFYRLTAGDFSDVKRLVILK